MSYQYGTALFDSSDAALKAAWYDQLNLGELNNEQLKGLTAQMLYDSMARDVGTPTITEVGTDEIAEFDEEDHVDAIQAAIDREHEDRVYYRAIRLTAGSPGQEVVDEDSDWDEIVDTAQRVASNHLDAHATEPVWCGPEAWHPEDDTDDCRVAGGYECGIDKGGGANAILIYEVRP